MAEALLDPEPRHPTGRRRTVPPHISDTLDLFAKAAESDTWESVFPEIQRAAEAVLVAQEYVCWWHVRLALYKVGKLSGAEKCAAAGRFARRMGLVAMKDGDGNVLAERPSDEYNAIFPASHANRGTKWERPKPPLLDAVERHMRATR